MESGCVVESSCENLAAAGAEQVASTSTLDGNNIAIAQIES